MEEGDLIRGACSVKPGSGYNEVAAGPCSATGAETSNCLPGEVENPPHCRGVWKVHLQELRYPLQNSFIEWHEIVQWASGSVASWVQFVA